MSGGTKVTPNPISAKFTTACEARHAQPSASHLGGSSFAALGNILQGEFVGAPPTRVLRASVYQTVKAILVLL